MRQPEWYFCGPACLAMAASFFGLEQDQYDVARMAKTNEAVGTTHHGMGRAARRSGMYIVERHHADIKDVMYFIQAGLPVIVYLFMPEFEQVGYGELDQMHYVVVTGFKEGEVLLHDPEMSHGKPDVAMPLAEFMKRWRSERSKDENWMLVTSPEPIGEPDECAPLVSVDSSSTTSSLLS